jgi:hypothetical protein
MCAASKGLPSEPATEAELAAAVQRLINSMPTREQLAALQAADPETKQLLEWYRKGRSRKTQVDLPSKWRKEARYLKVVEGVLYFRPVLDPHDDMVDVPVLPSGPVVRPSVGSAPDEVCPLQETRRKPQTQTTNHKPQTPLG